MATDKSLEMRYDKGSLSNIEIRPNRLVELPNGATIYVCKSSDGEYYASKDLGGQVINISNLVMKAAPPEMREAINSQLEAQLG